jgi:hypothetical protein
VFARQKELTMFPPLDPKLFEQFNADPATFLGKLAEFQRANFEAAREIADNNNRAFQQLASIRDPQEFFSAQGAILQAAYQQNVDVLTRLWQPAFAEPAKPAPKPASKK